MTERAALAVAAGVVAVVLIKHLLQCDTREVCREAAFISGQRARTGAAHMGVPIDVIVCVAEVCLRRAVPKSATLTVMSPATRQLAPLMSLLVRRV